MESTIINLFAGPSAGKSSIASGLTYKLKKKHITCDNPYEFTKDLAWDRNREAVKDQLFVFANQHRNIVKSFGKVKFIIVDSPILLSLVYKDVYGSGYPSSLYGDKFDEMALELHRFYPSINIFLNRSEENHHNDGERFQNIEESLMLDNKIREMLRNNGIQFHDVQVGDDTVNHIIEKFLK